MAPKRDWVDYTNLAANVIQTAQLGGINSKLRQMAEIEAMKEYREQQEAAVAKCEDLLREVMFFYSEQLRDVEEIAKSSQVAAYIRANYLKCLYKDTPQLKASRFRKYEDKERLSNMQRAYDGFIRQIAQQLSPDDFESSDRCITYILEREKLVQLITAHEKWEGLAVLKVSVAKQVAPKLAALQKIKEEQLCNPRPWWKLIFDHGKTELDIQAEAIELEIDLINQAVTKAEAGFSETEINHYSSFFKNFKEVKSDDYKNLLRERDTLIKRLLGGFATDLIGDNCFDSLNAKSPPNEMQKQHAVRCDASVKSDVVAAQSALAKWTPVSSSRTGAYIFGPDMPAGGFFAKDLLDAFAKMEKTGFLRKGATKERGLVDWLVSRGYTFMIKVDPQNIEVIGSLPISLTSKEQENVVYFLGLNANDRVIHKASEFDDGREVNVSYVLYGS